MTENRNSLTPGYKLHWYVIKEILGQGGFGITYLAEDTNLNQLIAIKEFLPVEMAVREHDASIHPISGEYGEQFKWGLKRFMSEAQTLAQFKHPNIVRVFTVFPENNTAYMVMEYESGKGLQEILKEKKTLTEKELKKILLPILDGLAQVHAAEFIHRDIKPANIFIREYGSPVLLDFGSARHALGQQTRSLTTLVSPGFAPFEQYVGKNEKQGPWTDIYGLGATLYRAVIGRSPAEAMDRSEVLLHTNRDSYVGVAEIQPEGYSNDFLFAIDHALAFKAGDRPQTISSWRRELVEGVNEGSIDGLDQDYVPTVDASSLAETIKIAADADLLVEEVEKNTSSKWMSSHKKTTLFFLVIFLILLFLFFSKDVSHKQEEGGVSDTDVFVSFPELIVEEPDIDDKLSELQALANKAHADIAALRLSSPTGNNALEKYAEIKKLAPQSPLIKEIHEEIVDKYIELSLDVMKEGDLNFAHAYLAKVQELNPEHPGIDVVKDILNRAKTASLESDVVEKEKDSLISENDRRQLDNVKKRLNKKPDDNNAKRRLGSLVKSYEARVK